MEVGRLNRVYLFVIWYLQLWTSSKKCNLLFIRHTFSFTSRTDYQDKYK